MCAAACSSGEGLAESVSQYPEVAILCPPSLLTATRTVSSWIRRVEQDRVGNCRRRGRRRGSERSLQPSSKSSSSSFYRGEWGLCDVGARGRVARRAPRLSQRASAGTQRGQPPSNWLRIRIASSPPCRLASRSSAPAGARRVDDRRVHRGRLAGDAVPRCITARRSGSRSSCWASATSRWFSGNWCRRGWR